MCLVRRLAPNGDSEKCSEYPAKNNWVRYVGYQVGKVDVAPLVNRGAAARTIARELVAYIRQPGIAPEAINQACNTLPTVAVALGAADLEKMKGDFKVPERA